MCKAETEVREGCGMGAAAAPVEVEVQEGLIYPGRKETGTPEESDTDTRFQK